MVPASEIEDYLRNFDLSDEAEEERRAERQRSKARWAEEDALTALAATAKAARGVQDNDFHALLVTIGFQIHGFDGQEFYEDHDPSLWEFSEDGGENSKIGANIVPQVLAALAPLVAHYEALGLVPLSSSRNGPQFCLVYRPDAEGTSPESLAQMPNVMVDMQGQPGATLELSVWHSPLNATAAFDEAGADDVDVGHWGGAAANGLNRQAEEARDQWLARVAMPAIARTVERWEVSGRDPEVFQSYGDTSEREMGDREIAWLVDGRIPRGEITLLAGNSAAGKSSLVHAWMAALGGKEVTRARTVLDLEISGRFVAALISGEDDNGIINYRAARHAKLWGDAKYLVFTDMTKGLDHYLAKLWAMPVLDLVILDPVRSFFVGNEKDAIAVNAFLSKFLALARAKNCAVILVHHITKGSARDLGECRSLAELKGRVRGSGAFIELPRMVIGAVRRKDGTVEVGPVKYNLPPETVWLAMGQGRRYWPNPDTFTLDPLPNDATETGQLSSGQSTEARVLAAIERCNRTGSIVRKSGKTGLFESKLPELGGLSRAAIWDAIGILQGQGAIMDGEAGLIVAPASL